MPLPTREEQNPGVVGQIEIGLEDQGVVVLVDLPDEPPEYGDTGVFVFGWESLIDDYLFKMSEFYADREGIIHAYEHAGLIEDTDQLLTILADFADRIRAERKRLIGV